MNNVQHLSDNVLVKNNYHFFIYYLKINTNLFIFYRRRMSDYNNIIEKYQHKIDEYEKEISKNTNKIIIDMLQKKIKNNENGIIQIIKFKSKNI